MRGAKTDSGIVLVVGIGAGGSLLGARAGGGLALGLSGASLGGGGGLGSRADGRQGGGLLSSGGVDNGGGLLGRSRSLLSGGGLLGGGGGSGGGRRALEFELLAVVLLTGGVGDSKSVHIRVELLTERESELAALEVGSEFSDGLEVTRGAVEKLDRATRLAAGELEGEVLTGDDVEAGVQELGLGHGKASSGSEDGNGGLHDDGGGFWFDVEEGWLGDEELQVRKTGVVKRR